jgi:hypothetical protein
MGRLKDFPAIPFNGPSMFRYQSMDVRFAEAHDARHHNDVIPFKHLGGLDTCNARRGRYDDVSNASLVGSGLR